MTDPVARLRSALAEQYRLERELGRGGMAVVWLAHDLRHDRPVALKVLLPHLAAVLGPERFQREIRLAARLQHPHILSVFDSGEVDGLLWFTMPYVRGESLRDRLAREGRLSLDEAFRIAREAAQALQYAHDEGIVHRDIKPENILLTADGSTLVADFGVARSVGAGSQDQRLTDTGLAIGTPAYMSPEQAMGEKDIDARTDQYALATVCWEMLAGALPFTGPTPAAMIASRLTVAPPSVRAARADVGEPQDHALRRALATRAADRFASVAEFSRALRVDHATHATATAVARATAPLRRHALLLTLLLGVLLGLGALFAARRAPDPAATTPGERRVAVLPFTNLGDTSDADFADGVTDAVRGNLTALPGLTVIASTSSNDYRDTRKSPGQIARELRVRYLLIGKVRWAKGSAGARVQVSPELVEIGDDGAPTSRWQRPFDSGITDVFQVQGEIATQVAQELGVALGSTQHVALEARPTENVEAYEAYVRGLRFTGQMSIPTIRKSREYMQRATTLDSTFGEAWAELARSWAQSYLIVTPTPEAAQEAEAALSRARRYAPSSTTTTLAEAMVTSIIRREVDAAATLLRQALARSPNDARILLQLAFASHFRGDWSEVLTLLEKARELDPRQPQIFEELAQTMLFLRRYAEAEDAADSSLALRSTNLDAAEYKAMARVGLGDTVGARAIARATLAAGDPLDVAVHFAVYWDLYWLLDADAVRMLLAADSSAFGHDQGLRAITFAQIYQLRGDRRRSQAYARVAADALLDQLRSSPEDIQRQVLAGLALALAGHGDSAVRLARPAVERARGFDEPYMVHQLVRIHMLNGDRPHALELLERVLAAPYFVGPTWLTVDPNFAPLRGDPRFDRLAAGR